MSRPRSGDTKGDVLDARVRGNDNCRVSTSTFVRNKLRATGTVDSRRLPAVIDRKASLAHLSGEENLDTHLGNFVLDIFNAVNMGILLSENGLQNIAGSVVPGFAAKYDG